jgi:hypothetical protein
MKIFKTNKPRYYYSKELGVLMPVPMNRLLKYLIIAIAVLLIVGVFIIIDPSQMIIDAREASYMHQDKISESQSVQSADSVDSESVDMKPQT